MDSTYANDVPRISDYNLGQDKMEQQQQQQQQQQHFISPHDIQEIKIDNNSTDDNRGAGCPK